MRAEIGHYRAIQVLTTIHSRSIEVRRSLATGSQT